MVVFVRAAMDETVTAATDNADPGRGRRGYHPVGAGPGTRAFRPRSVTNEPWGNGFLSPYEGSFHPYGLNVLKGEEGALARRLRSHG